MAFRISRILYLYLILASFVLNEKHEVNLLVLLVTYFESIMTNTKDIIRY